MYLSLVGGLYELIGHLKANLILDSKNNIEGLLTSRYKRPTSCEQGSHRIDCEGYNPWWRYKKVLTWRNIWRRSCSSQSCRINKGIYTFSWWWDSIRTWYVGSPRTSPHEYLPQEKASLGPWYYSRSRKVWFSGRILDTEQEAKAIF